MKIEFYTNEGSPRISQEKKEEIRSFVIKIIENTIEDLGAKTSIFDRIIFTDEDRYGEFIKSIDKNEGYTNNEFGVGFGKTINKHEKSSIIYRIEILVSLINIGFKKKLTLDEELTYYVFRHEIGHAIDNNLRKPKEVKSETTFEVRKISEYYIEILISEFCANWNSAKQMSKGFFDFLVISNTENMKNYLADVKNIQNLMNYTLNQRKYGVADRLWSILMQISQLLGLSILLDYEFKIPSFIMDEMEQQKMKETFLQISKTYPVINKELKEELYLTWKEMYKKEYEI